jgi:hypothetical protein
MNEWAYKWISFDMSREGLLELDQILEAHRAEHIVTDELHNFHNEIVSMLERNSAQGTKSEESSWLDA